MQVPETARQEIKFVAKRTDYELVMQWIKLHPLGFSISYPDRTVNNVYFDTFELEAYAENLAGVSQRTKVRYRWYGESKFPAPGRLEIKQKRNQYGWKLNFDVKQPGWDESATWFDIKRDIAKQAGPQAALWLEQFSVPIMMNRYLRTYYLSACGRIRITLDFDQQSWDQRYAHRPTLDKKANLLDTFVFECKFDRADRAVAERTLLGLPIRVSRHSKYMNSVNAII